MGARMTTCALLRPAVFHVEPFEPVEGIKASVVLGRGVLDVKAHDLRLR